MNSRARRLLTGLLAAAAVGWSAAPARAQAPVSTDSDADFDFAQQMTFRLDATSDVPITAVRLFYQGEGAPLQQVDVPVTPGLAIHAEHTIDLRGGVFPPFSRVTYWWEIESEGRPIWPVPRKTIAYLDDRFEWQRLSDGGITVHWADGDKAFAEAALDTALDALPAIEAELGASPPAGIELYVYPSREDLKAVLRLSGREWASGQARPELGVMLVDIPPGPLAPVEMRRSIPHELTHLLVYDATQPGYARVPTWLNEGLATANEASPDPAQAAALAAAAREGRLVPLEALCAPFSDDPDQALLAYAQSGALVQFVRNRYGAAGIRGLLAAYREGATCAGGVQRALGVTLPALEHAWRADIDDGTSAVDSAAHSGAPWLVWLAILGLVLLPIVLARPKRKP